MRILVISDLLAYGGASKLINDLLPRLKDKGNYCELLILSDEHSKYLHNLDEKDIPYTVVPPNAKSHIQKIIYIKRFIKNGNYDVIHANLFPVIYYVSIVKRIYKSCPPIVMTEHSTDNKRRHKKYLRPLEKFIYSKYNHVISISKQAQEQLLKWLRFKSVDKYSVIENGIDIQRFKNAKPYDKKTICNNYKDGDILISLVGSFSVQKNHKNMVMAMKLLPDNYKLLLIGEGPLMEDIKLLVKDNCLQDRIRFMGFRTDVAEIIHTSDLVCIPSLWEGFGLIAAEAMACGTAVVSSNVTGLSDVIGDCGYKFNPNEPQSISEAIIKTVKGKNKNLNIEKGKKHAEKFDIDRLVDEYLYIYEIVQQ